LGRFRGHLCHSIIKSRINSLLTKISFTSLILIILLVSITPNNLSANADWPKFHENNQNTGMASDPLLPPLTKTWEFKTARAILSSPAIYNGVLYVGSEDANFYAINATTGKLIWKYKTGRSVRSSPAVSEGIVYFGSNDNNLYALDAETGTLLWNYTTMSWVHSSPVVNNNTVYIGSLDGRIYALNSKTGEYLWHAYTPDEIHSSPAIYDGIVYIGSYNGNVYAYNAKTGHLIGFMGIGGAIHSSPCVYDHRVYVGEVTYGGITCFLARSGELKWHYNCGSVYSSPAVSNDTVYVQSVSGTWAFNRISGEVVWNTSYGSGESSPAICNGVVYACSHGGTVYALNASTGESMWNYTTGSYIYASPAISDEALYVCSYDYKVYRFVNSWGPGVQDKLWSEITCTLSSNDIEVYDTITISSLIVPERSEAKVTIEVRKDDAAWMRLDEMGFTAFGYRYLWTPPEEGDYQIRVSWPGDYSYHGATSTIQNLTVGYQPSPLFKIPTSITCTCINPNKRYKDEGDVVCIYGYIEPTVSEANVTLSFMLEGTTREYIYYRHVLTDDDGRYEYYWNPEIAHNYSWYASWEGNQLYFGANSSEFRIQIYPTSEWDRLFGCIIATAAYGSEMHPDVLAVRQFRDTKVGNTYSGSNFLIVFNTWYYSWSPPVANLMSGNEALRFFMRLFLKPLMFTMKISENSYDLFSLNSEFAASISILVAASLCGIFYITPFMFFTTTREMLKRKHVFYLVFVFSIILIMVGGYAHLAFVNTLGITLSPIVCTFLFADWTFNVISKIYYLVHASIT